MNDAELRKYHAAVKAWRLDRLRVRVPSGKFSTWAAWWSKKFGQDFGEYIDEQKRTGEGALYRQKKAPPERG